MTDSRNNTPTSPSDSPAVVPDDTSPAPTRSRGRRGLWIGGGAVLAGLVLVGGGAAIGAAIADDHDDDRDSSAVAARDGQTGAVSAANVGTASAADLIRVVESASTLAEGDAIAIDAERDGAWDVTFVTASGDESEVRVPASGAPSVLSTEIADADDTRPAGALDNATIESIVAAALADTDGTVTQIEIDDDGRGTYDAVVQVADGRTVDIELDADLTVTSSRIDD
ncbi:PepSY domain-containing protein [Microbacterium sp. cx-59]|uniref:PepSY domain-containing protein n=1 Tax=Microbacterium sp. cx-59 TaxID=2891207 RepID=UPI001E45C8B6|nr:hypothetical protein [Microbacterium sp. cx-59]MCC4908769.1 hypothetical protein [Microbacterium sp. cx-59]